MIRIRHISQAHPLYAQARDLAARITHEGESQRTTRALFAAVKELPDGDRVVGCIALRDGAGAGEGLLEWFAVDPQLQGQDLGRRLLAEAETAAFASLGFSRLICDAPSRAKAFLSRMGWMESTDTSAADGRIRMQIVAEPPSEMVAGPDDPDGE